MELRFRAMGFEDEQLVLNANKLLLEEGFQFAFQLDQAKSWKSYLDQVQELALGRNLKFDMVQASYFLVFDNNDELVGRVSIRHSLNKHLYNLGGHIGYCVLPEFRLRGYATQILKWSIKFIKNIGVESILVTCDEDNIGSKKVIQNCGGVLCKKLPVFEQKDQKPKLRYWINN